MPDVSDNELIERAAGLGIVISPAAIDADANELLRRSGIFDRPTSAQQRTARRAAIEGPARRQGSREGGVMSTDLKQLGARRGFTSANEGSPETCAD